MTNKELTNLGFNYHQQRIVRGIKEVERQAERHKVVAEIRDLLLKEKRFVSDQLGEGEPFSYWEIRITPEWLETEILNRYEERDI